MEDIGLIAECGPYGADIAVFTYAIERMAPDLRVVPAPLENKKDLLSYCRDSAKGLLERGCKHVLIAWDLYPSHSTKKPSRRSDEEQIMSSLEKAGVPKDKVSLICVVQELEAWLLADRRALAKIFSTKEHPVSPNFTKKIRNPDIISNPKGRLRSLFSEFFGKRRPYNDLNDALDIAKAIPNCRYLSNSRSFVEFSKIVKSLSKS